MDSLYGLLEHDSSGLTGEEPELTSFRFWDADGYIGAMVYQSRNRESKGQPNITRQIRAARGSNDRITDPVGRTRDAFPKALVNIA